MSTEMSEIAVLLARLPLPLAQLHRRAQNAKNVWERHQAAYYLWEAALRLLASVALVEWAEQPAAAPDLERDFQCLARPSLGDLWRLVKHLAPRLIESGHERFRPVSDLVVDRSIADLLDAAELDSRLAGVVGSPQGPRQSVRLTRLFDRMVQYRNEAIGHAAAGLRSEDHYESIGKSLLAGVGQILARYDFLAGWRLVYVDSVQRTTSGGWEIHRLELRGEQPLPLDPIRLGETEVERLPRPDRVYVEHGELESPSLHLIHPFLVYSKKNNELLFLNSVSGESRVNYLGYSSGEQLKTRDFEADHRHFLGAVLRSKVTSEQLDAWAQQARVNDPATGGSQSPPARILGEFELLGRIGAGGMGVVYRAFQPSLGRTVALKCLMRCGNTSAESRFVREIKSLGRIDHPHVVKIFSSGVEGDQFYYAMELVEGADLAHVSEQLAGANASSVNATAWQHAVTTACEQTRRAEVSTTGEHVEPNSLEVQGNLPPPSTPEEHSHVVGPHRSPERRRDGIDASPEGSGYVRRVVEAMRQVALGAHALHEANVVHRDIKPGNIMLTGGGDAVLMDLGMAKLIDESDAQLTRTRQFVGTLRYASPEQVAAIKSADRRTDVYSIGITLWELLTLRPAHGAVSDLPQRELEQRILTKVPESIRAYNKHVPADMEAVVFKCLEIDPDRRYQTARELAEDLRHWLADEPVSIRSMSWTYRPKKYLHRRRWRIVAALLGVCLLAGAYCVYCDAYVWDRQAYFRDFVSRFRIPEGLGPLTAEQVQHRQSSIRITRHGRFGPVTKLEMVSSRGRYAPDIGFGDIIGDGPLATTDCASDEFVYVGSVLAREVARDYLGREVWTFVYAAPLEGQVAPTRGYFTKDGVVRPHPRSQAAFVEGEYSPEGFMTKVRYFDQFYHPRPNADGCFGMRIGYDKLGRFSEATFLGANGEPAPTRTGYARINAVYDSIGNPIRLEIHTAGGGLLGNLLGYVAIEAVYDQWGNRTRTATSVPALKTLGFKSGLPTVERDFNERGDVVEERYLDDQGKLTLNADGIAGQSIEYDERGNPVKMVWFGVDHRPGLDKLQTAGMQKRFENDREVSRSFFGLDGNPVEGAEKYAGYSSEYDAHGRLAARHFFDKEAHACLTSDDNAGWKSTFDERNREIERTFLGTDGQPRASRDGYAAWTKQYDDYDNAIETAYFDARHQLTALLDGVAMFRSKYDDTGQEIERTLFGADRQPTLDKEGIAGWTKRYDEFGHVLEWTNIGLDGKPIAAKNGVARGVFRYDSNGKIAETKWYDDRNRPLEPRPIVTEISPGSRAELIGLKKGDILLRYDNVELSDYDSFLSVRRQEASHSGKPLVVQRGDAVLTLNVPSGLLHFRLDNWYRPIAASANKAPTHPPGAENSSAKPAPEDPSAAASPSRQ